MLSNHKKTDVANNANSNWSTLGKMLHYLTHPSKLVIPYLLAFAYVTQKAGVMAATPPGSDDVTVTTIHMLPGTGRTETVTNKDNLQPAEGCHLVTKVADLKGGSEMRFTQDCKPDTRPFFVGDQLSLGEVSGAFFSRGNLTKSRNIGGQYIRSDVNFSDRQNSVTEVLTFNAPPPPPQQITATSVHEQEELDRVRSYGLSG